MIELLRDIANRHLLVRLDGPALLLLVPVLVVAGLAALYSPAYLRQPRYREESRTRYWLMYSLFVAGMAGTAIAADFVLFLVCWEVMTLASYVLVVHETREEESLRAGYHYFVMTHGGTGCLLLSAVLLRVAGGTFAFDSMLPQLQALALARPALLHTILALMFVGFATKAGLVPFGDWLPRAHPAAPAPVSAVLSGVMVKLGLYGLLRFFVMLLAAASPATAVVWGWVIGGFGLVSALAGGFAACAAMDAKVLLAYSSIAQSGFVAMGFGAALVLQPASPALAGLALLAAAFLLVSDAAVKSLLFLNAGALQWRACSRRLEDLGGLFEAMPVTGRTALVGALAIAGFPPLAAFTGKWLLLQSTVLSRSPAVTVAGLAVLVASLLSVLYAVKFFAATLAHRPMLPGRLEVPRGMAAPQVVLAILVLVIGVLPGPLLALLSRLLAAAPAAASPAGAWTGAVALSPPTGALAPLALVVLGAWTIALARVALGRSEAPIESEVWTGGVPAARGAPPVHPLGFYSPVRESLRRAYPAPRWRSLARPAWLPTAVDPDRWLYRPALAAARRITDGLRHVHTGVPHVYLAWQLAGAGALVLLLLALLRR
jgi:hydrogenase-4 component B